MSERKDISFGKVTFWAGVFFAFVIIGTAALWWVFGGQIRNWRSSLGSVPLIDTFARPLLQEDPQEELTRLRAREDRILSTYAWTDQANGWARVPITKAMDAVVKNGVPENLLRDEGASKGGKP